VKQFIRGSCAPGLSGARDGAETAVDMKTPNELIMPEPNALARPSSGRLKLLSVLLWLIVGLVALSIPIGSLFNSSLLDRILAPLALHISSDKAVYSPLAYFILLSVSYFLERTMPVREQSYFSAGFWHDALWYLASMLFKLAFLGYFVIWLQALYLEYLSFLTVSAASDWSPAMKFVVGILVADFTRWLSHLIRHKVPLFWTFHSVHHAQRELNIFTDARVHPIDRLVSSTLRFIPLMMFGNSAPVIMAWLVFETIYPKFYHANIRLNLGPLRYVLVTPQSHRIHHGMAPAYRDRNFGFTFSIWDRIFGTQYPDHSDYPATGIADPAFPHETREGPLAMLTTLLAQLIYPFRKIFARE
jgi:sterol desaturase/sphingolipid hydroxylase (fatty acid hydroxylase superfamily)